MEVFFKECCVDLYRIEKLILEHQQHVEHTCNQNFTEYLEENREAHQEEVKRKHRIGKNWIQV